MAVPKITVVTINYNNEAGLRKTIDSVINQTFAPWEYLIIDGASTDGSAELIESYNCDFIRSIIEPDDGIYHAMNKAISLATGDWLLFMNSGDIFYDRYSLEYSLNNIKEHVEVIYGNWQYFNNNKIIRASHKELIVRHQAVIYKKSLHVDYGLYVVGARVTISDYLFFSSICDRHWHYHCKPLCICDKNGISSYKNHFYQKLAVDFIFGRSNRFKLITTLIIYPVYSIFKSILNSFFRRH